MERIKEFGFEGLAVLAIWLASLAAIYEMGAKQAAGRLVMQQVSDEHVQVACGKECPDDVVVQDIRRTHVFCIYENEAGRLIRIFRHGQAEAEYSVPDNFGLYEHRDMNPAVIDVDKRLLEEPVCPSAAFAAGWDN